MILRHFVKSSDTLNSLASEVDNELQICKENKLHLETVISIVPRNDVKSWAWKKTHSEKAQLDKLLDDKSKQWFAFFQAS